MSPLPESSSSHRKAAILLGLVAFLSFIYFYEGGGWNQNSRFDLLRAIVERHTLQIDAFHENTQDKAHFRGHYYSDKAPGLVFLAVPFALAARPVLRLMGVDPESPRGEVALSYLVSCGSGGASDCVGWRVLVFSGAAIRRRFERGRICDAGDVSGNSDMGVCGIVLGACTGGSVPCVCVCGGVEVAGCLECAGRFSLGAGGRVGRGMGDGDGISCGSGFGDAGISGVVAGVVRGRAVRWRVVAGVGLGAGICVIVLMAYLHAAFGAFRPSYSYYDPNSFSFMQQQGYLGLTYPHPDRLLKLLFGCSRGIVLCLAGVDWRLQSDCGGCRRRNLIVRRRWWRQAIAAYYFLFNASFYWWKAGLSFGPRYAGACIPLLCIGLAVAWERATPAWRWVLVALAVGSVLLALMVVSTTSQLAMQDSCPVVHSAWPAFWSGQMAMNRESMLTAAEAGSDGVWGVQSSVSWSGCTGLRV